MVALALLCVGNARVCAQVPQIVNYQGRVAVGGVNYNAAGSFKFALVNSAGTATYWSNDGTSTGGAEPTNAVSVPVANGLFAVPLGDTSLANMTALPASVFANNADVRLRVWFNDSTHGSQLLSPDQRIAAVGYAVLAGTVPNGAITAAKIDPTTVQARITGTAPSGQVITGINADGTVATTAAP